MIVRSEEAADVPAIRAVHEACFPTAGEASLVDARALYAAESERVGESEPS